MAGDISRRDWGFSFTSSAVSTPSAVVPYDDRPVSEGQMIAIHIYVFGGLAFFIAIVMSALLWLIVHLQEDFVLATKNLPRRPGFRIEPYHDIENWERAYEENVKRRHEKKKAREDHIAETRKRRRILQSAKHRDSQRISWASSTATVKADKMASAEEMSGLLKGQGKEKTSVASTRNDSLSRPTIEAQPKSILIKSQTSTPSVPSQLGRPGAHVELPRPSSETITPIPKAHTGLPRNQVHIEPNANIGHEMIATTGPDEAESWSGPKCTCGAALDDIDALIQKAMCEVHRFN
ncbi:hypothetical protein EST38_g1625 [Candolleomyces aberdarensis]|uniref:Uncharacterized protein n=1 Tax=Candolleomyces aberdarensis TaxID=2316362 RepID=A0A4Q2DXP7_9AGAR|nr:hypothetical protein EST38_g1625 [Candolleomyces aberdarensis]